MWNWKERDKYALIVQPTSSLRNLNTSRQVFLNLLFNSFPPLSRELRVSFQYVFLEIPRDEPMDRRDNITLVPSPNATRQASAKREKKRKKQNKSENKILTQHPSSSSQKPHPSASAQSQPSPSSPPQTPSSPNYP